MFLMYISINNVKQGVGAAGAVVIQVQGRAARQHRQDRRAHSAEAGRERTGGAAVAAERDQQGGRHHAAG